MLATVIPTLAVMAEVYGLSTQGGADSPLFRHYVSLLYKGEPLQPYNPMAGAVYLPTIGELRDLDAERLVVEAVDEVLVRLGWGEPMTMLLGVSHPGAWTDRITTEAEHRLRARPGNGLVLLWAGEPIDAWRLRLEAQAQAARAVRQRRAGAPRTVREAFDQEGWVYAVAGAPAPAPTPEARRAIYRVLDAVGDDDGLDTMVTLLYGDGLAGRLGWPPLGVPDRVGYEVALDSAHRLMPPSVA